MAGPAVTTDTPAPAASRADLRTRRRTPRGGGASGFRPDIQGLRALAVTLVLLYHLWPDALPGGYIGVDVFFVISGFLISQHLFRELSQTGRVAVPAFWARRIRRLLPASLLVLIATLAGTALWMPASERIRAFTDIGASAVYAVNWVFARGSVDYLAQDDAPSVVQHYWSLAVEEQLYVIWPILIVGITLVVGAVLRRRGRAFAWSGQRRTLTIALGVVFAASLVFSATLTATSPGEAYFNTFVRAWEFAGGALLALLVSRFPAMQESSSGKRAVAATLLTWTGVAMILVASFTYTDASPFPGTMALLPVAGTLIAIMAGAQRGPVTLSGISTWRPIASIGTWSYSIYLWHWPIIVLAPFALQRALGDLDRWIIVALAVLLGALSSRFIEDPARSRRWGRRPWREFAFAVVVPLVIVLVAALQVTAMTASIAAAAERAEAARVAAEREAAESAENATAAEPRVCYGVAAMLEPELCIDPFTAQTAIDTAFAATDLDPNWCLTQLHEEWRTCTYGDPEGPAGTLALVGDSHAAAMIPAFHEYFAKAGWRVDTFTRFACSAVHSDPATVSHWDEGFRVGCANWGARVQQELRDRTDISVVVYHVFDSRVFIPGDDALQLQQRDAMREVWSSIEATGKQVLLLRDIPVTGDVDIPTCLSQITVPATAPCSQPVSTAVLDDPITAAAGVDVPMIDITDLFCTDGTCMSYIGGVVAYADSNHVSGTYARSLAPILGDRLLAALE
ncbi:acyltransferase [Microbacterium saccharophilum]|uniref:Acyltransferase n=1 Tax=Microbacterium saccharophilum TaxID=1213358 RepID=A0A5C8IAE8_9MICO|nr:acyltransferase family protein [Microbacterium saccharophilum]TXK15650.1 acyltransferase [Microbacterium saccharophilum]GEP47958.1 acyltransferase [Microbacterium saccharophilum]